MVKGKQLYALGLTVFTLPAVYLLPKLGWAWAAVATGLGAVVIGGLIALHRRDPRPLVSVLGKNKAGKIIVVLLLLWNLLSLGAVVSMVGKFYPTGSSGPLMGLLLLLLGTYCGEKGIKVICRTGAILFFFLAAFYLTIFAFSLPQLELRWLSVSTKPEWTLIPAVLAPVPILYLCGEERGNPLPWLAGGGILAILAAIFCAGGLSPAVVREEAFPFYTATKSVSVFGVMERMEALVSSALTAGAFALSAVVCAVNRKLVKQFFPMEKVLSPFLNFILGGGAWWILPSLPVWILSVGTTIFWGVLPLAALSIENSKNIKKIEKRC